jgi:NADPH-dependent 2,4-dienoyl-CoA reductase/sulfur reductase-like enzyme
MGNPRALVWGNVDLVAKSRRPPTRAVQGQVSPSPRVVIIGGGASGGAVADNLRSLGFGGEILILSQEPYPPIDRTKLSKALITDASKLLLRTGDMLRDLGITLQHTVVTQVNTGEKYVVTESGEKVSYDKLVLATGGTPKMLPLPGFRELKGLYVLRTVPEAKAIVDAASGGRKNIVIIGTGFIGMEIAIALHKDHNINIIGMEKVPL